ncbi:MAG: DsrE family protein [Bacteroidetes bacterium]|nr:DsrE family protein [Bacteroidota bacterium]MBL6944446.1 DsrE family protein [Bacteroidales bacterium]
MKKIILLLTFISYVYAINLHAQQAVEQSGITTTSIGMVIYSNDTETVWNALRLANYSKSEGDTVSIFLLGKGVEVDNLVNENEDLKKQVDSFLEKGGTIFVCGTCLHSRKNDEPQVCTFSSLSDLYDIVRKNKIILTF